MSKKKNGKKWWEITSAADDGDLDDDLDSILDDDGGDDLGDDDWIDRFNFGDYRADKGLSSTDAIWKRYGYTGSSLDKSPGAWRSSRMGKSLGIDYATAKKVEAAQRLVQGFVDTFAIDNPLSARFSNRSGEIGGAEGAKTVVVSHRPLLDPTLTEHDAHSIMTAQAANAAARARYGGQPSQERRDAVSLAASAEPIYASLIRELGEVLDGYRIDSAFRRDYPGYEDVYTPAQRYIATGLLHGRESFDLEDFAGASLANAALNFAEYTNWVGREDERTYWSDWAAHYANADIPTFVKGVLEGVSRLDTPLPPKPEQPKGKGGEQPGPKGEKGEDGGQPGGDPGPGGSENGGDPGEGKGEGKTKGGSGKPKKDEEPTDEGKPGGDDASEDTQDPEGDDTDSPSGGGDDPSDDRDDAKPEPQGGTPGGDDDEPKGDEPKGDEGGDPTNGNGSNGSINLPIQLGGGVSLTGLANGQSKDMDEDDAERLAATASALAIGQDEKEIGEVYWSANGFKGDYRQHKLKVEASASANGFIRRAFTRSKTAHYAVERGHKTGRIDNRSLPRIASDDYRLFAKKVAPSETRYRVWLLIDNSGSMSGGPSKEAANLAASVALAVRHIPNVVLDVWAWTSALKVTQSSFSAVRIYANGESIQKIGDVGVLPQGGTPDASVLSWATREIRKQCRPDETPVILMASDGQGSLSGEAFWRNPVQLEQYRKNGLSEADIQNYVKTHANGGVDRVAEARKRGVKVLSVAIGALDVHSQDAIYGRGNHLIWNGSIQKMAKPLGDLIARIASNRIK